MANRDIEQEIKEHMIWKAEFIMNVPSSQLLKDEVLGLKDKVTDGIHFLADKAVKLQDKKERDLF